MKLGGRVDILISGGAPTNPNVFKFLQNCFKCMVTTGYGTTETGGITGESGLHPGVGTNLLKNVFFIFIEVKLVDVPDLGYFSTDKPYPRGEIWVK
jgi:long-chain acyl-CoA synthetase